MSDSKVTVKTTARLILVRVGPEPTPFQEIWLTRNEALALLDALPSAINKLPTKP